VRLYGGRHLTLAPPPPSTPSPKTASTGGAITAGINLAADALFTHTAKLQRIDLQRPPSVIGRNTTHAMQSGLLFGYVSMAEGMVKRFRDELGEDMKVIATGGLAEIIANETRVIDVLAPWPP
jgi:type III pantothenate kinase